MDITWLVKMRMAEKHIKTFGELSKLTGIKYQTLVAKIKRSNQMRLYELKALAKALGFQPDEIIMILEAEK